MIVTRFAPSPTGHLHLGHAFAALTAFDTARSFRGRFLLRIEDLDRARCRAQFEEAIFADLRWLGLTWEMPVMRQALRTQAYRAALHHLDTMGMLYPCFCTRKEIADEIARSIEAPHAMAAGPEGPIYPGTCRSLSAEERRTRMAAEPYALRLDVAKATKRTGRLMFEEKGSGPNGERGAIIADPMLFGDIVLARKDLPAAYHLAVVVDDAAQGVTLVTRGNDLFASTHVQRLLQALLGLPVPAYGHHRLILDESGNKFSKRDQSVTLQQMRESGATPADIRARVGLNMR